MSRFLLELSIVMALLLFEVWNVSTAKKRGSVFLKLRPIIEKVEPEDFKTALMLNRVLIAVIAAVGFRLIWSFLRH
jgi:hypothetical protein